MAGTIQANISVPTVAIHQPLDSTAKLNYTYRNKLINGDLSVWQRGTPFSINPSGYTADRWLATMIGSVTRMEFASGESELMDNDQYYLLAHPTGGDLSIIIEQRIENVRTMAGKQVTLTFWAKAEGSISLSASLTQHFGTAPLPIVPSADEVVTPPSVTILTSWSKHTITITLPSVASKVIGTNGDHYLALKLTMGSSNFYLSHLQLEQGPLATDFEKRHPGEELRMARRYYEQMDFDNARLIPAVGHATAINYATLVLPYQTKRIAPTIVVPSSIQVLNVGGSAQSTAWTTVLANVDSSEIKAYASASGLLTGNVVVAKSAGSSSITIDAEL